MATHTVASIVTYGTSGEVRASEVRLDAMARPSFVVESPWGRADVRLAVSGVHMASNALAALAVAGVIEGSIDAAAEALAVAQMSSMRMEVHRAASGAIVVNDAYNANPDSMQAALEALASIDASRRVAIVGVMAELADPVEGHRRAAEAARSRGIELIATGTELYGVTAVDDPVAALGPIGDGDAVLVKASRVAGLERIVEQLLAW
jgi:UDP-N-acetylmuramoyl-tripeptide--D-alanyl-D-alanine ligase